MFGNLLHRAVNRYSEWRFGGARDMVSFGEESGYAIPTQIFNYAAENRHSDTAVVFIPGFATIPQLMPPGALGAACKAEGVDFVRFYHPHMLMNHSKLTYDQMVLDALTVVDALPHDKIILAASSFGGGVMPIVAGFVENQPLDCITGMFSWMSVPPAALLDLFKTQKGWDAFAQGESKQLKVKSPTLKRPFYMSRPQYDSVMDANDLLQGLPEELQGKPLVACPKIMYFGQRDVVGRGEFTHQLAAQMGNANTEIIGVDAGNRLNPELIERGLRTLIQRSRAYNPA